MSIILVIDDNPTVRRLIYDSLSDNHEVLEAADGKIGIQLVKACTPALVITDIIMPNKEGIETISEIRRLVPDMKIIAISGSDPAREQLYLRAARQLGADLSMTKPFRPADLRSAVEQLLREPTATP